MHCFIFPANTIKNMKILKKIDKQFYILLAILTIVLFFMVIISSTLAYFSKSEKTSGSIQLGELDFNIVWNMPKRIIMPGDNVSTNVTLENKVQGKENLIPFYYRFQITNSNFISLNYDTTKFIYDGNFYYYKFKVQPNENSALFNSFTISKDLRSSDTLSLGIIVDAVQSEYGAYKEIFTDAPTEWVEFIENN